jgi:hypothetical protein
MRWSSFLCLLGDALSTAKSFVTSWLSEIAKDKQIQDQASDSEKEQSSGETRDLPDNQGDESRDLTDTQDERSNDLTETIDERSHDLTGILDEGSRDLTDNQGKLSNKKHSS